MIGTGRATVRFRKIPSPGYPPSGAARTTHPGQRKPTPEREELPPRPNPPPLFARLSPRAGRYNRGARVKASHTEPGSRFAPNRSAALVAGSGSFLIERPKGGREGLCLHDHVVALELRIGQRNVFHVDDPIQLPDAIKKLGDLMVATHEGYLHGHPRVELIRDFRLG